MEEKYEILKTIDVDILIRPGCPPRVFFFFFVDEGGM